jgi:TetR/AcrR family transcriptional regulator
MDQARTSGPIFPRLSTGPRKMEAEAVARHQRGRLEGAMVDAVARHGYAETTLRELVTLAGVSKGTFYEHFESKQDCFLTTFDDIIDIISGGIEQAVSEAGDPGEKLLAGLHTFTAVATEEKEAAYLAVVESLTLGADAVPHRDRAAHRFEAQIRQSLDRFPGDHRPSDLAVRGIVAGLRNCVYHRLRDETIEELPGMTDSIAAWVLSYSHAPGDPARRAAAAAAHPAPVPQEPAIEADGEPGPPGWDEPPDSPLSRKTVDQRERIIRAAARVGVENGYEALSIPAIASAAAVSNQTFYDHFPSKRDAFVAAFDALAADALRSVAGTFLAALERPGVERPEAIGIGLRALLDHIAGNPLFARLAFFELPAAGPAALDHADTVLGGFTSYLEGEPDGSGGLAVPKVVGEMIGGAIWAVIQHEINSGKLSELPCRAPEIAEFTLAPFDG